MKQLYFVATKTKGPDGRLMQSQNGERYGVSEYWLSKPFDDASAAREEAALLASTDQNYSEYYVLKATYKVKKKLPPLEVST